MALDLPQVTESQNDKEVTSNTADAKIEGALSNLATLALADANLDLTTPAANVTIALSNIYFRVTSALTADRTITLPDPTVDGKIYVFENATTGGFNVIISRASGGTQTVLPGDVKIIYNDGTDILSLGKASEFLDDLSGVDVTSPSDQDVLTYISSSGNWEASGAIKWSNLIENVQTGSSYTQVAGDRGKVIVGNNGTSITVDLLAAATAGVGFLCLIKNIGVGDLTIDPNAAETIDGAATKVLAQYEWAVIWTDGSTWRTLSGGTGGSDSGELETITENQQTGTTYTQLASDQGKVILGNNATGITVTLLATATAGAGFAFFARNIGTGAMVLDGNGAETIEGSLTYSLLTGESAILWTDGSLWYAFKAAQEAAREVLKANRTYYVRSDGSDSNNGLTNTSGGAFLTLQHAVDVVAGLDLSIYGVTIQIGLAGTYAGCSAAAPFVGGPGSSVTILGNTGSPGSYVISSVIQATDGGVLRVSGLDFTSSSQGIYAARLGVVILSGACIFGTCSSHQIYASQNGVILLQANYTIDGGATAHYVGDFGGFVGSFGLTLTLSGTPAFSASFVSAGNCSVIEAQTMTFSGTGATGQRYNVSGNANVHTAGGGATYFPGNSAGATTPDGEYT